MSYDAVWQYDAEQGDDEVKLKLWVIVDGKGELVGDGETFYVFRSKQVAVTVLAETCEEGDCRILSLESREFKIASTEEKVK